MTSPRFSVVIPTRERAGTLVSTLRSCLDQDFDDYEVVVCDNDGSPATREAVDGFASPRIKYVRAPHLLAMGDNWELGLAHAEGEYVTVLGDDDGLMPYALVELDRLIRGAGEPPAVRWSAAFYTWPDLAIRGEENYLRVPLGRRVHTVDARAAMASVLRFQDCYTTLPTIYNAMIRHTLLAEWRQRGGRLFRAYCPDVYSGFALAHLAGQYVSTDAPMTVAGLSGRSFGVAMFFFRGRSPLDHEVRRLNEARYPIHPTVPDLPVFPTVPVADAFQWAKDTLFPRDDTLTLDRQLVASLCVENLRTESEADWRQGMAVIRGSLADVPALAEWFDTVHGPRPFRPVGPLPLRSPRLGFDGDHLHLDAAVFGVASVHDAVRLCEKVLNYRRDGLEPGGHAAPSAGGGRLDAGSPGIPSPAPPGAVPPVVASLRRLGHGLYAWLAAELDCRRMIDVGAHHGTVLGHFVRAGWDVIGFEPIESNRLALLENSAGPGRLVVRPEAVSDSTRLRELHLAVTKDGRLHEYYHSLENYREDVWHRKGPTVSVAAVSLDDLAAAGEVPVELGFLKVNTEGHDLAVLRGCGRLRCQVICVEFWRDAHALGPSPSPAEEMIALLRSRGYADYVVLAHDADQTQVLYSTMRGTHPGAWGDIFFFHETAAGAYQRLRADVLWQTAVEAYEGWGLSRGELVEKEAVIQSFHGQLVEKEAVIQSLHRKLVEKRSATLRQILAQAIRRRWRRWGSGPARGR